MPNPSPAPAKVGIVTPVLRVEDVEASRAYYVDALGFQVRWTDDGFICVERGDTTLFLCQGAQGHAGTWLYVGVDDADALHEELLSRGAIIRHPPTNYPWGSRELHVFDPDGHVFRFGASAPKGAPLGEWLDENGRRWLPQPDGSWVEQS